MDSPNSVYPTRYITRTTKTTNSAFNSWIYRERKANKAWAKPVAVSNVDGADMFLWTKETFDKYSAYVAERKRAKENAKARAKEVKAKTVKRTPSGAPKSAAGDIPPMKLKYGKETVTLNSGKDIVEMLNFISKKLDRLVEVTNALTTNDRASRPENGDAAKLVW